MTSWTSTHYIKCYAPTYYYYYHYHIFPILNGDLIVRNTELCDVRVVHMYIILTSDTIRIVYYSRLSDISLRPTRIVKRMLSISLHPQHANNSCILWSFRGTYTYIIILYGTYNLHLIIEIIVDSFSLVSCLPTIVLRNRLLSIS